MFQFAKQYLCKICNRITTPLCVKRNKIEDHHFLVYAGSNSAAIFPEFRTISENMDTERYLLNIFHDFY